MNFKASKIEQLAQIAVIIFIVVLSSKIPQIFYKAITATRAFISAEGSYNQLRLNDPVFSAINQARQILPKNARVNISPVEWNMNRVKARYALYPIQLHKDWDFFIDLDGSFKDGAENLKKRQLSSGTTVFAKPGRHFVHPFDPHLSSSNFRVGIIFLAVHICFVLFGIAILAALNISTGDNGFLWYLSTSYLAGSLALTLIVWLFLLAGLDLTIFNIILFWISGFFLILLLRMRRIFINLRNSVKFTRKNWAPVQSVDHLVLTGLVLLTISSLIIIAGLTPVSSWDAMANWVLKSKIIFQEKKFLFGYTYHNEYPILWPLNIAIQFSLTGGFFDEIAKWTTALLIIAFSVQLAGALRFLKIKYRWICVFILLYFACFFHNALTYSLAETPFLAFFTAGLAATIGWLRNQFKASYMLLAMLMAIGFTLVKLEGAVAAVILGASLLISCRSCLSLKKVVGVILGLLLIALMELGWIIWNKSAGFLPSISQLQGGLTFTKFMLIIRQDVVMANNSSVSYGLFAGLFIMAWIKFSRHPTRSEKTLWITSIAMILFGGFAAMGWDIADIYQIGGGTTLSRLFLHATPAMTILLGSILFSQQDSAIVD